MSSTWKSNAVYQELATISAGEANHGTVTYRSYTAERNLFHALKITDLLEDPSIAHTIFDVAGGDEQLLNNKFNLKDLLIYLVQGKVKEYTSMIAMLNDESALSSLSQEVTIETNGAWSMICVNLVAAPFLQVFFKEVYEALKEAACHQRGKTL